ncbi:MAG: DUF4124 domain-containing protein [Gammaproteobacteria bacterium]|nr:DUF4124 domain-containing protein [Gammaproteobacteria bacterium]MBU1439717.1 DUF4124 domain-containing protein [Gammaproteobacteria bacterium]MBU2289310.1 DUF4124 domain-containing protein [Gammaproteobacteria bacterium]
MKRAHFIWLSLALALPVSASAQWQWIDKDNKKVFSDKPPPVDVPESKILKQPKNSSRVLPPSATTPTPAADATATPPKVVVPKPSGVDKELEEKTRKAEEAEKAKQAAEAQKLAQAKAENCNRARQGKATFDSGIRVARINPQGEREVLDDKARAAEQQRLQSVIDSDCK